MELPSAGGGSTSGSGNDRCRERPGNDDADETPAAAFAPAGNDGAAAAGAGATAAAVRLRLGSCWATDWCCCVSVVVDVGERDVHGARGGKRGSVTSQAMGLEKMYTRHEAHLSL